ncbi:MAG: hypothetical protein NTZ69_16255 [Bacteroidia bacterium]|nr:hypothetical protein [Bacteroidia bacterium]
MKIIIIFLVCVVAVILSSCCFKCRECTLKIKYAWKVTRDKCDIVNMQNDSLIFSEIYFKSDPSRIGNTQHVYEDKNYVINKENGLVIGTLPGFVPGTAENKYLHNVGKNTIKKGILFETTTSQFTVSEDYKGYKIVLQEWYKNIRSSNNTVYSVLIFKGKRIKSEYCLPGIYDFTFDKTSLYFVSSGEVYKFNFDELIK